MTNHLELMEVRCEYADEIWAFRKEILEYDADNENQFAGCLGLSESQSAEEWVTLCRLRTSDKTCLQAGVEVPSHTFMAIRKEDQKLVGIIDLRHHIDHPILGTWGGHSGYSVRPTERGRGYAKEMLRQNLGKAKELGIQKLLATCCVDNTASRKTILANGGAYESTIDVDNRRIERYWITVS